MRFVCLLILLATVGAVAAFAVQNQHELTLTFFGRDVTASVPLILGCTFLLGMIGGWTIVGILRRSVNRMLESPRREYAESR
jgi:uncharacterized integral membrane protein